MVDILIETADRRRQPISAHFPDPPFLGSFGLPCFLPFAIFPLLVWGIILFLSHDFLGGGVQQRDLLVFFERFTCCLQETTNHIPRPLKASDLRVF